LALHFFSDYSFRVHHLVNQDDRHLLAHAMASDFSAAWQCLSKRTIGLTKILYQVSLARLYSSTRSVSGSPPPRAMIRP
jgi:hypothetical protein